jgi:hypothetical protein
LAFVFLLQTSSKSLIYFRFLSNQAFVAKNLCEKKNTKKNKCNGKCHLKKQMKKDDAAQNDTSDNKKEKSESNYSVKNSLSIESLLIQANDIVYEQEKMASLNTFHSKLIKPPSA